MEELRERLQGALGAEVTDLRRLSGGASRETWAFSADGGRYVLRRDPPGAPVRSDRHTEVELLRRAKDAGVPVPEILRTFDDGFVMPFVDGETRPKRILADPPPDLAAQCGEALACVHRIGFEGLFDAPSDDAALAAVAQCREILDTYGEPHPAFELGMRWLEQHTPASDRTTLVHGDFRNGNLIVGPDGIRAVLDWELAHAGDPLEDLGWLCVRAWRFGGNGAVGGFGGREELYRAYEQEAGMSVDRDAARWWEALGTLRWGVITIVQAFTHLGGHVRSVELAAIGRRTVECEHDLLELIG